MNKITVILVFTVAALLLGAVLAGSRQPLPSTGAARPALSVSLVEPAWRELPVAFSASGSVAAWQEAIIGAEVSGLRLAEVRAQVGDAVTNGQLLALFADDSVLAEIAQGRAALAEAEAAAGEAEANAGRARRVTGSGALSEQQVVQYLTAAKTAQARLQSARAQLQAQLLRQRHTRVVASDDGVISSRSATLGAVAAPGQELFRLIRQNRMEWRGEVAAAELPRLQAGVAVTLAVPGLPAVSGRVRAIAPTLDAASRNALVYVDLPGAVQAGLRPGMFGRGEFQLGASAALVVPQEALSLRDGFSYVFRLTQPSGALARVVQVKVEPGRRLDDLVELLAGVAPGDRLVASGGAFLTDGDSVRVVATTDGAAPDGVTP